MNALIDEVQNRATPDLADLLAVERDALNNLEDFVGLSFEEGIDYLELQEQLKILQTTVGNGRVRLKINGPPAGDFILHKTDNLGPADWRSVDSAVKELQGPDVFIVDGEAQGTAAYYQVQETPDHPR